jgi:hypothetical protein
MPRDAFHPCALQERHVSTLTPPSPQAKKIRGPWIAGGLLLVVLALVAAIFAYRSATQSGQAIALVADIAAGEPITRDLVRAVDLPLDVGLQLIPIGEVDDILGQRVRFDLPIGTLLTRTYIDEGAPIEEGQALVGLAIEPGGYPTPTLAPGDAVAMLVFLNDGLFEVARGTVYGTSGEAEGGRFLTLTLPSADGQAATAVAAHNDGVGRLVAIPDLDADLAVPLLPVDIANLIREEQILARPDQQIRIDEEGNLVIEIPTDPADPDAVPPPPAEGDPAAEPDPDATTTVEETAP